MPSTSSGVSPRMGLAIATAVTGLVLATGVSVGSLVGWVRPAQLVTETVAASAPVQTSWMADTSATPQVVLVPIAPVSASAQSPVGNARLAGGALSTASEVLGASRHTDRNRSESPRAIHGERDDD
jgi:hypothetical protein